MAQRGLLINGMFLFFHSPPAAISLARLNGTRAHSHVKVCHTLERCLSSKGAADSGVGNTQEQGRNCRGIAVESATNLKQESLRRKDSLQLRVEWTRVARRAQKGSGRRSRTLNRPRSRSHHPHRRSLSPPSPPSAPSLHLHWAPSDSQRQKHVVHSVMTVQPTPVRPAREMSCTKGIPRGVTPLRARATNGRYHHPPSPCIICHAPPPQNHIVFCFCSRCTGHPCAKNLKNFQDFTTTG